MAKSIHFSRQRVCHVYRVKYDWNALGTKRYDFVLRPHPPPVMMKETDGVNTVWIPPTEAQLEQQVANPHPRAGTCFYANLRRKVWVRVDADGFPLVRAGSTHPPG
jgi:hypothetical protein